MLNRDVFISLINDHFIIILIFRIKLLNYKSHQNGDVNYDANYAQRAISM